MVMKQRYGEYGSGDGSLPEMVMRTGTIRPFNPRDPRQDIKVSAVERATRVPVSMQPSYAVQSASTALSGALLGSDAAGRPVREFVMPGAVNSAQAERAGGALKRIADFIRQTGIAPTSPLVGGPLAALARGEAVVLRWTNGVAITAAL